MCFQLGQKKLSVAWQLVERNNLMVAVRVTIYGLNSADGSQLLFLPVYLLVLLRCAILAEMG